MYLTTVLRRHIWCYLEANTCVSELPAKLPSLVVRGQKKKKKKNQERKKENITWMGTEIEADD